MRFWNKMDWKRRLIISVFLGVVLVVSLLFGVTYHYFQNKLEMNNEKIANLSFQETERNLKEMMANAEWALNKFSIGDMAWKFSDGSYSGSLEKDVACKNIVQCFDEMLKTNSNIYGFAILSGDGRTIVSTAKPNSGSGKTEMSLLILELMEKCQEDYPYVHWNNDSYFGIPPQEPLHLLTKNPAFIGMKALGHSENTEEDCYLIVAIEEKTIQKSYERLAYNESQVVLVNGGNEIISSTNEEFLGAMFIPEEAYQNIEYNLSYNEWKLINIIAKENYALEARDIRNFAMVIAILALLLVLLFFVVWSRKYTRPIQNLMEQMNRVGKEQLDIPEPVRVGWLELDDLNREFYVTVQKLKDYIQRLQEAEQEKAKEELRALQYQINPHFLYNSLNSIRWMAMMTNNTKVADSLVTLSKIIMPIMGNPSFTWFLKDELEFIENYVEMMRIRYGSYMEYHLNCVKKLYDETFPRFILQPVIENCFVHGSTDMEMRHISLDIEKKDKFLIIIRNSDTSLSEEEIKRINEALESGEKQGKSIGLYNVQKRLRLLFGDEGRIWLDSSEQTGVAVHIVF